MNYPRYVYAIYPHDEDGNIAGVYVGTSQNVEQRIRLHRSTNCYGESQFELHQLMRKHGYSYEVLDSIRGTYENYKEYKWIEILSKKYSKVFNKSLGNEYQGKSNGIGSRIYQYLLQNSIHVYTLEKETHIKSLRLLKILDSYVEPNVIEYYKICKALQLPLDYFLEGIEE